MAHLKDETKLTTIDDDFVKRLENQLVAITVIRDGLVRVTNEQLTKLNTEISWLTETIERGRNDIGRQNGNGKVSS